ncbi:MAG: UDP-N-acetylmuramoyl-tripeptide--D-alanyl-D-alanine ligase [Oscillospiraceae bacterium]|nr:UDP-N-acetylmuramoyl-tripeptide--D-alanyl-D-alanine ligase [Oscillospiraceae bacterium]
MERMTLQEIAERLGTTTPVQAEITEISTDTRNLPEGCLFIALRGEKFDGHSFVRNAIDAGAVAAVTDTQMGDNPCIVVSDTGQALLDIASLYREKFDIPVIGITGSVGKTTTKEMTASVLSQRFKTLKTQANLNNVIGCPKTLLGLTSEHGAAVIEMGMNHFGEISRMSHCTKPTMAVITNIGFSHVENLGSQEGILRAKLEMLEGMNPHAPLIVSGDDKLLAPLRESLEGRLVYTFSTEGNPADVMAEDIKEENGVTTFTIVYGEKRLLAVLPAIGVHNVKNALAAFLVGTLCGMEEQEILCGIAEYRPTGNRQNIMEKNGQTVIADCYNASPASMEAALSVLANYPCEGRKVAVLGDMLELGAMSDTLHEQVGAIAKKSNLNMLYCYGPASRHIAAKAGDKFGVFCTEDAALLTEKLQNYLKEGDVVLFKASHGMHLEHIIEAVYGA